MASISSFERERQREVYKYYQPFYIAPAAAGDQRVPRSSWDVSLTTFAQLGALRLNAKRCLISLVTHDTKYVIAEATQTLSLRRDDVHEDDDELWFGVCALSKDRGICAHSVDIFAGHFECGCEAECVRLKDGTVGHIAVNNLLEDSCNFRRKAAESNPNLRFYISVPIVTAAGHVIGAYSIADNSPRNGVSPVDLTFLKDMSRTVMDHLVTMRAKSLHYRAEKMIKGMGLFVEGGSSLRQWWLRTGHESSTRKSENSLHGELSLDEQADYEFGVQDAPEGLRAGTVEKIGKMGYPTAGSRRPLHSESGSAVSSIASSQRPESVMSSVESSAPFESVSNPDELRLPTKSANSSNTETSSWVGTSIEKDSGSTPGGHLQEAVLTNDLKNTFSRASNLIRESLAISGALFLDASIGSFGGRSKNGMLNDEAPSRFAHIPTSYPTSSSDDERRRKDFPAGKTNSSKTVSITSKNCGVLGFSSQNRSSMMMHTPAELHSSVPEYFLRRLLKRYPHGKIFNLDDEGNIPSSGDEMAAVAINEGKTDPTRKAKRKQLSKEAEFQTILEILPGARSIAFFPLWDAHKERWFAGGFLWTTEPTRVFVPEDELTFFAAFSNSIMAEVARLDALVAAQMKINFMSSISHELRSPLHGVLAGVELLQDSDLDTSQADMVKMIDACGRTLLDTINHVLSFTKINSKSRNKARGSDKKESDREHLDQKTSLDSENTSTTTPDLAMLTEEVVSSVYAGHHRRKFSAPGNEQKEKGSVMIIMDIAFQENYSFSIEAGAWRRLIMNLFSNALKYTSEGFVKVSLQSEDSTPKDGSPGKTVVTLSVNDSGQGIAPEYLQNHLYTPFQQEDALSAGTGLGLSMIRQIVDDLGGEIDLKSEKGTGTEAIISLPLFGHPNAPEKTPVVSEVSLPADIQSAREKTRGLRVNLVSFDVTPDMDDTSGILSHEAKAVFQLKSTLCALLKDWFQMNVNFSTSLKSTPADVYVILESQYNELKANGGFDNDEYLPSSPLSPRPPILLVLSSNASEMLNEVTKYYNIFILQQPFGPHRMAKVLSRCLGETIRPRRKSMRISSPSVALRTTLNKSYLEGTPEHSPTERPRPTSHRTNSFPPSEPRSRRTNSFTPSESKSDPKDYEPDLALPNVLLVEDNEINLRLLVSYMRKIRVSHSTANNGLEALQTYKSSDRPFDIILMDISMPVMDGFTSSREIRRFENSFDRIPATIIALTGAASPQARQEAFASGIDRYLTKPVPLKVLKTILDEFQSKNTQKGELESSGDNATES